ncbi:MGH1-like glycoside hydrolase domain-containing protein [Thermophagus sp. OGC60D27]|uniref:MGH1-like glycoside hydrolase domain-containing protein n=1 Tax=Thermophagus sp. OGC60D27 TaxID=3458415 RepID=UPI004037BEE2
MVRTIFLIVFLIGIFTKSMGQLPAPTPENIEKYKQICRKYIYKEMKGMYRTSGGSLKYPFLAPGSNQYLDMLWDWDSWLSNIALRQILLENGNEKDRIEALQYEQGCVLNALSYGGMDGWIPIWIERDAPSREEMLKKRNPWKSNMHKPTLAQHAAFVVQNMNGDAEWLRDDFYFLQAFVSKYLNFHRHAATGLMYWETDEAIGVDNDPSTFYRPYGSSGSIFLNALMYKELLAISYLAERLNLPDIANYYNREADQLLKNIREHCWDPRDGFYYSVDLNLRPIEKPDIESLQPGELYLHVGQPRTYDCLIQRFSIWSGFMAMWANIATPEQAEIMVKKHFRDTTSFNAPAGVRTLSPLEKMYDVRASGNPSSWLGPVWINVNYLVFRGLVNYGYDDDARVLAEKTILLLGRDFERFGALHEYYLPDNGEPVLNKGFQNWNFLVLNMAAWLDKTTVVTEF